MITASVPVKSIGEGKSMDSKELTLCERTRLGPSSRDFRSRDDLRQTRWRRSDGNALGTHADTLQCRRPKATAVNIERRKDLIIRRRSCPEPAGGCNLPCKCSHSSRLRPCCPRLRYTERSGRARRGDGEDARSRGPRLGLMHPLILRQQWVDLERP